MEDRIVKSVTRQVKAVFPGLLNANETLFGGHAMKWMDEVAFLTATRFTRQHMYTVKVKDIQFLKAIEKDSIIELVGRVVKVGRVKLTIEVKLFQEEMYGACRDLAMKSEFTFAALDENKKTVLLQ